MASVEPIAAPGGERGGQGNGGHEGMQRETDRHDDGEHQTRDQRRDPQRLRHISPRIDMTRLVEMQGGYEQNEQQLGVYARRHRASSRRRR